jgi:hypothetical protein
MWMLVGIPIGLAFAIVWSNVVKTSPTLAAEERVRGWETVLRDLPASLFLIAVVVVGLLFAVRAGRTGSADAALRAIWFHGVALFFVLGILLGGSADNVMTTRSATVKWMLFPIEVGVAACAVLLARRAAVGGSGSH